MIPRFRYILEPKARRYVWPINPNKKYIKSIHKNGVIDQENTKRFSERKCADREYHIQDNYEIADKDVKNCYNTKQLPALTFCGPHYKPYGSKGLSKHYHFIFYPKLGNDVCAILRIMCACVACI